MLSHKKQNLTKKSCWGPVRDRTIDSLPLHIWERQPPSCYSRGFAPNDDAQSWNYWRKKFWELTKTKTSRKVSDSESLLLLWIQILHLKNHITWSLRTRSACVKRVKENRSLKIWSLIWDWCINTINWSNCRLFSTRTNQQPHRPWANGVTVLWRRSAIFLLQPVKKRL